MEEITIVEGLDANESQLKTKFGSSIDLRFRHLTIPAFGHVDAFIVYISGLADSRTIDQAILEALMKFTYIPKSDFQTKEHDRISALMNCGVFTSLVQESRWWADIYQAIAVGDTVLFIDQCATALILASSKNEYRAISEPTNETEVKGSRDGFVEEIGTNTAILRRRIKDIGLRFEGREIGRRSRTNVVLAYIEGLADEALLDEVRSRLRRINADSILASENIEECIEDSPFSLFPQIASTERPDRATAAILEGRIVILIDNTPSVLIVPTTFWQMLHSSGDYYQRFYVTTVIRIIRLLALLLSISFTSIYVLMTAFHQEMLPTGLALNIAAGRAGVPFPAVIEALIMEVILEIMKEAELHMPKAIGPTVTIVGTLVIGQASVAAGLISPFVVIVIAVAAIASYAIPSFNLSGSLRLLRFILLFATSFLGLFGYLGGMIAICLHLLSLRSFGTPYLSPIIPFNWDDNKDVVLRVPWWAMRKRPVLTRPKDMARQTAQSKPRKPQAEDNTDTADVVQDE